MRALWRLLRFVVGKVFAEPVATGRLKDTGWPAGLKVIVVVWAIMYAVVVATAVFATTLRSRSPLMSDATTTLPMAAFPLVTVALIFALTCLYVAGLHLVWWLRIPVTVVVVAFLVRLTGLAVASWTDVAVLVVAGLLVVLTAVRWGRRFHWWEFVVALTIIGHGVLIEVVFTEAAIPGYGIDLRLNGLSLLAGFAWSLATPAALVAGAAMAELTVSAVAWTVTGFWQELRGRRRWSPAWGVCVVVVLVVLRAAQIGWYVWHDNVEYRPLNLLPGVWIVAFVVGACAFVAFRADRVRAGDPPVRPDPDDIAAHWSGWSMLLAALLGVALTGLSLVTHVLRAFGLDHAAEVVRSLDGSWAFLGLALTAAVAFLVIAVVLSGRGRRMGPIILAAVGAYWIATSIPQVFDLVASAAGFTVMATVCAVAVFCWLLARRRLTGVRVASLVTVLVLTGVFEYRDVLEEPLTAAFSLVGVSAAVLVGLVWRMLTDTAYSRGDSRRFPLVSRVLIALASTTYAVLSVGLVSLVGGQWPYDVALVENAGDTALGFGLAGAAVFAGLSLAARGRLVRSDQPRDDYGKLIAS